MQSPLIRLYEIERLLFPNEKIDIDKFEQALKEIYTKDDDKKE